MGPLRPRCGEGRHPVNSHSVTEIAIGEQITQLEKISKEVDLRPLRWSFMHMEGVTPPQIERMKKLNMFIALNPADRVRRAAPPIQGDKGNAMPPMREIQDSGIMWGRAGRLRGQSVPPVRIPCSP